MTSEILSLLQAAPQGIERKGQKEGKKNPKGKGFIEAGDQ